jgi:hypothetical protein
VNRPETITGFVEAVAGSLPPGWQWSEAESALLQLARHQARDLELLEADIAARGAVVEGRGGGAILNASLREARQSRLVLTRILRTLGLEAPGVETPKQETVYTKRARKAARARWGNNAA